MRTVLLTSALLFVFAAAIAHADISINSGGPAVVGYLKDAHYSGGAAWSYNGLSGIYATERWTNTNFSYKHPYTRSVRFRYTVHFRQETCSDCTTIYNGPNSENVAINGTTVLSNFTLGRQASCTTACWRHRQSDVDAKHPNHRCTPARPTSTRSMSFNSAVVTDRRRRCRWARIRLASRAAACPP